MSISSLTFQYHVFVVISWMKIVDVGARGSRKGL